MVDPVDSLAFSIQANPGVYALLLGSGVSRAAQIPTGWEITLDLLRKLAAASDESAEPDPEQWYRETYGEDADYSGLIDRLAGTQADRQQLLRGYFEPNQQEREEGAKQPTAAHRAIADLVARGFVRVVVTTNFDRLMERALEDAGVSPTVVSSQDHIKGMLPLIHTRHCLIKVHGDYQDTRIRNTSSELDTYPDELDQLLDQVFDEFGLVVCGWSADWDAALRNAMYRAPSRRFSTFWATLGEPSDEAQRLANHRAAHLVPIEGADWFFEAVQDKVVSIQQYSHPHPLSTHAAVTSLKRYLSEPRYRIQRADLIDETVERVVESVSTQGFDMYNPTPDTASVTARVRTYEAACSTLLAMATIGGRWAEDDNYDDWQRALERFTTLPQANGNTLWLELRRYPATLLLYALGLGALTSKRLHFLGRIFSLPIAQQHSETKPIVRIVPPFTLFSAGGRVMQILEGMEGHYTPLNDRIHKLMTAYMTNIIPSKDQYDLTFDTLEILLALSAAYHRNMPGEYYAAPLGAYGYRTQNAKIVLRDISESVTTLQENSPFVTCGIFGNTVEECQQGLSEFTSFLSRVPWSWF